MCVDINLCPDAREVTCSRCYRTFETPDPFVPEPCPECGSRKSTPERCAHCPVVIIPAACARHGAFNAAVQYFEAHQLGLHVDLRDLDAEVYKGFQIISQERQRYVDELRAKQEEEGCSR